MDPTVLSRLEPFAADCRTTFGSHLRAVLVFGDAEATAPAPALLLDAVTMASVRKACGLAERWRRTVPTPLLLDDEYLCTSCDVFPLELLALRQTHQVVWGDASRLTALEIDREHLRLECEEQLKGKILHLRQAFVECRGRSRLLVPLLLDSSAGFEMVMRALVELAGIEHARDPAGVVRAVQQAFDVALPAFERIQQARRGSGLRTGDADALFEQYHDELVALARATDRITRG